MTLTSYSHKPIYNFYHPMHIHGHEFYVMQKGYGKIDMETMNLYPNGSHPAFECTPDEPYCATTRQVWPDEDLNLQYDGIQKRTTVTIPANGWVVVRFIANNPGMWLFHCHTFSHLMEGQAILLDVTDQGIPKVPVGFPTCPVNSPKRIDKVELVPIDSIGVELNEIEEETDSFAAKNTISTVVLFIIFTFFKF